MVEIYRSEGFARIYLCFSFSKTGGRLITWGAEQATLLSKAWDTVLDYLLARLLLHRDIL